MKDKGTITTIFALANLFVQINRLSPTEESVDSTAQMSRQDAGTSTEPTQESFPTFIGEEHCIRNAPTQTATVGHPMQQFSTPASRIRSPTKTSDGGRTAPPTSLDPARTESRLTELCILCECILRGREITWNHDHSTNATARHGRGRLGSVAGRALPKREIVGVFGRAECRPSGRGWGSGSGERRRLGGWGALGGRAHYRQMEASIV